MNYSDVLNKSEPKPKSVQCKISETWRHAAAFQGAAEIVEALENAGHSAYFVGGFVRKLLLGGIHSTDSQPPSDIDIATSADPSEVKKIFRNSQFVGQTFGVSLVRKGKMAFEVATFRKEGPYSDGRRPDHVSKGSFFEDSSRRDFTINALYFSPATRTIFDFHNGISDANLKILRSVGHAHDRFEEDRLRIMRLCRFAANNGLTIDQATWQAAQSLAHSLTGLARERVLLEIQKTEPMALSEFCRMLHDLGVDYFLWGLKVSEPSLPGVALAQHFPMSFLFLAGFSSFHSCSQAQQKQLIADLSNWPTTAADRKLLFQTSNFQYLIEFCVSLFQERESAFNPDSRQIELWKKELGENDPWKTELLCDLLVFNHLSRMLPIGNLAIIELMNRFADTADQKEIIEKIVCFFRGFENFVFVHPESISLAKMFSLLEKRIESEDSHDFLRRSELVSSVQNLGLEPRFNKPLLLLAKLAAIQSEKQSEKLNTQRDMRLYTKEVLDFLRLLHTSSKLKHEDNTSASSEKFHLMSFPVANVLKIFLQVEESQRISSE